jgi:putative acetyltransferase
MKILVRKESFKDYQAITKVNNLAFGQENEGRMIELLRKNPLFDSVLSLVAEYNEKVIGHILFFPVKIINKCLEYPSISLAPMSVIPEFQNNGIGSLLVNSGFSVLKKKGYKSVIVLGHKAYYPRFGFQPASKWKIHLPFEVPDDCFMAIEIMENGLKGISGTVIYPDEYNIAL